LPRVFHEIALFAFRVFRRQSSRAPPGGDARLAHMPIEQFVVSEVEAARSPSYGLSTSRVAGWGDPWVLGGTTSGGHGSKRDGTKWDTRAASPRFGVGDTQTNAGTPGATTRGGVLEFFAGDGDGYGVGGGFGGGKYGPDTDGTGVTNADAAEYKPATVFLVFLAHAFFASTMGLFNDLLILKGFHAQFALLALHNCVCGVVGFWVVTSVPTERGKKQLRVSQIVRYCVPLAVCHSAKLYAQNKALEFVSPALVSITYGATPVLVALVCVLIGWEPLRLRTGVMVSVAAFGVALTAVGELNEARDDAENSNNYVGLTLAFVSVVAEVGRLVLLEHLLRNVKVTIGALLVYTAPLETALLSLGAALFETSNLLKEVPLFDKTTWWLLLVNTAWALCTNVSTYFFVRVSSALLAACSAPFKDVGTIVLSDLFVEPRHESRLAVFGYSIACVASFAYVVVTLGEREERGDQGWSGGSRSGSNVKSGSTPVNSVRSVVTSPGDACSDGSSAKSETAGTTERAPLLSSGKVNVRNEAEAVAARNKQKSAATEKCVRRAITAAVLLAVLVNVFFLVVVPR
jgi:drug/metabolite transporter (DMT)-like permease